MRCRKCDYPLWNIRDRLCPECGESFRPSTYEFVANSVQFCCPHCGQDYYGQDKRGHLVPSEFDCVTCSTHVTIDEMVLLPTHGVQEERTAVLKMPWINRREIGFFKAWFSTIIQGMFAPIQLMRADPGPRAGPAWWFMLLTLLISQIPMLVILGVVATFVPGVMGAFGLTVVVAVLASVLAMALWIGGTHLLLRIGGTLDGGVAYTSQAIGYTAGALILLAVPAVSFYLVPVAWLWWAVTATIAVKVRHKVSGTRAAICTLTPPVIGLLIVVGGFAAMITMLTMTRTTGAVAALRNETATAKITLALTGAMVQTQLWPPHVLDLVTSGQLQPRDFALPLLGTDPEVVQLGSGTVADFGLLGEVDRAVLVEEEVARVPDDAVAYRLGDFVFTYRGMSASPDPGLWIVVAWPDPNLSSMKSGWNDLVFVGLADGTTSSFDAVTIGEELEAQNVRREAYGLEPLIVPSAILADSPQLAADP